MKQRSGLVTMRGNPVTLVGEEVKVGEPAPDFVVIGTDMKPVQFASFRGKVCVIYSVSSLDTPVCDRTTRRFNEEATRLGSDVAVLAISMDLPFAQARWCAAADIKGVQTFSDHRDASFGTSVRRSYGRNASARSRGLCGRQRRHDPPCPNNKRNRRRA